MRNVWILSPILTLLIAVPSWAQDYVPGEIIVKMKDQVSTSGKHQFIGKASLQHKMSLKKSWPRFNMHRFSLKVGKSVEEAVAEMNADPDVAFAEPNYIFKKQSAGMEGEPLSAMEVQEAHSEGSFSSSAFGLTGANINAEEAWNTLGSSPYDEIPIVAVIDSGVDYTHYVFQDSNAIWENTGEIADNGIDDDGNGYIDDVRGWNFAYNTNDPMDDDNHGTHVAGIVLGMTQDILASTLEPAKVKIMPLKFLKANGQGSTSDAIEAINYAVNNGATILNNSWGGGSFSQALQNAIISAYNSRVSFIAAAGNSNNNNDVTATYPASYAVPNILSIAATYGQEVANDDYLASFSNFGAQTVHLGSPGSSILSTIPGNAFSYSSGTSMAAPFVAGLAALMHYEAGPINGYQLREILFGNSDGSSALTAKVSSESRINALTAVGFVQSSGVSSYQPEFDESMRGPTSSSSSGSSSSGAQAGGGCGLVKAIWDKSQKIGGRKGGGPSQGQAALILGLLLAPLALMLGLRIRNKMKDPANRRIHDRYKIDSQVKINIQGREIVGSVSSISLGGARVNTDALLESGGVVTMSIASPDGQQQIQVQGKVVWSEEKKAYGVQFCNAEKSVLSVIGGWTSSLMKI